MKSMKSMTFKLNTHTKLKFSSIFPIKSLGARYSVKIECVHRKKSYPIYNDDFADGLTMACSIFNDLIYTKLPIDFLKGQDIGYAYNKYLHSNKISWPGQSNLLWFYPEKYFHTNAHLYNNNNGNIVIHISKSGYWYLDKKKIINYKKFMESYKPLFVGIIDRKALLIVIDKFKKLLENAWINQNKYDAECVAATQENKKCKRCVIEERYRNNAKKPHKSISKKQLNE